MKVWLVTGAALVAAAPASAQTPPAESGRWTAFAVEEEGLYFYDADSVVRSGTVIRSRMREVTPVAIEAPIRSMISGMQIDCSAQTSITFRLEMYDGAGGMLQAFGDRDGPPDSMRMRHPIHPGTREEALYRLLCPAELLRPVIRRPPSPDDPPQPVSTG